MLSDDKKADPRNRICSFLWGGLACHFFILTPAKGAALHLSSSIDGHCFNPRTYERCDSKSRREYIIFSTFAQISGLMWDGASHNWPKFRNAIIFIYFPWCEGPRIFCVLMVRTDSIAPDSDYGISITSNSLSTFYIYYTKFNYFMQFCILI